MVRMVYCVMRRKNVSLKDFREYFDGNHKQLICDAASVLNATDFKQSLTLMIDQTFEIMAHRGTGMPYDGIIELWWENAAALEQAMASRDAQEKAENLFEQADQYIDLSLSRIFFTEQPRPCGEQQ